MNRQTPGRLQELDESGARDVERWSSGEMAEGFFEDGKMFGSAGAQDTLVEGEGGDLEGAEFIGGVLPEDGL